MAKNKYPHFNPKSYKIESKIATVKTGSHCKYNINYHIIWIPKYRKDLLKGKVIEVLKIIIDGICHDMGLDNLALEVMPDHIHLFVGAKPTHNPANIIKRLKGNTSIQLRRVFPEIRYLGYAKHYGKGFSNLWARGYYCGSAGHVSQEQVKRYIQEQEGKNVFEYDIYGCRGPGEVDTVFNEYENIFMRDLLRSRGVLTRNTCLQKIFKTAHIADKTASNLVDMGLVDRYQLKNWEVVYVLNLKFFKEVINDG